MTDLSDIEHTLYRYALGFDANDMAMLADCYTEDATVTAFGGVMEGRAAIRSRFEAIRDEIPGGGQPRHLVTNVLIEQTSPTEAESKAYFMFALGMEGALSVLTTGLYRDRWIKDGEKWRIEQRVIENDTTAGEQP